MLFQCLICVVSTLPDVEVILGCATSLTQGGSNNLGCLDPTDGWIMEWGLGMAGTVAYLITPVLDTGLQVCTPSDLEYVWLLNVGAHTFF